jgi:hypothetical protein
MAASKARIRQVYLEPRHNKPGGGLWKLCAAGPDEPDFGQDFPAYGEMSLNSVRLFVHDLMIGSPEIGKALPGFR